MSMTRQRFRCRIPNRTMPHTKADNPRTRRSTFPVVSQPQSKDMASGKIPVRDRDAEARRRRMERIRGALVMVAVLIVFGLLMWLAAITPPGNTSDLYYLR